MLLTRREAGGTKRMSSSSNNKLFSALLCLAFTILLVQRSNANPTKPLKILVACGFHAREWSTTILCERMLERVATHMRKEIQWIIIPRVNPAVDLVRNKTLGACWRWNSNRVDLNRNWPLVHDQLCPNESSDYVISKPGEETYTGPHPFSEPETRKLRDTLIQEKPDIAFFVHTGSEMILLPYESCLDKKPSNYRQYVKLAKWLSDYVSNGTDRVLVGQSSRMLYKSYGSLGDYATHVLHVPFAFTVETYRGVAHCSEQPIGFLQRATAEMTESDCEQTFVPHSPVSCSVDLDNYLTRWTALVDAFTNAPVADLNLIREWIEQKSLVYP